MWKRVVRDVALVAYIVATPIAYRAHKDEIRKVQLICDKRIYAYALGYVKQSYSEGND